MNVYVVVMRGVYIQRVVGVYSDAWKAKSAADDAKSREPDDYHDFDIIVGELDSELSGE